MTSFLLDQMTPPAVGLCATCRWVQTIQNRRGSIFYRCRRADVDPRFVRYPPLPVLACPGYERSGVAPGPDPPSQTEGDADKR